MIGTIPIQSVIILAGNGYSINLQLVTMKSLSPLSLLVRMCIRSSLPPYKTLGNGSLSLYKTAGPRWGCHGATRGRGARAHARPLRRGGSRDRPVWNPIPEAGSNAFRPRL